MESALCFWFFSIESCRYSGSIFASPSVHPAFSSSFRMFFAVSITAYLSIPAILVPGVFMIVSVSFHLPSVPYIYMIVSLRNFVNIFLSLYGTFFVDLLYSTWYCVIRKKVNDMTQGERVKEVRKALGLTLDKFGEKVGVKKQTVSRIENGVNNVTDQMVLSICREFNVNYDFLMNGEGEMFDDLPQTVLDELCAQYDLDDLDRTLVEMYIEMPEQVRDYLKQEIRKRFLKEDTKK